MNPFQSSRYRLITCCYPIAFATKMTLKVFTVIN